MIISDVASIDENDVGNTNAAVLSKIFSDLSSTATSSSKLGVVAIVVTVLGGDGSCISPVYPKSCNVGTYVIISAIQLDNDDDDDGADDTIGSANRFKNGKYFGIGNTSRNLCNWTIRLMNP